MVKKEVTLEEAQKVLQEGEKKKQQAFVEEYQALCKKHGMQLIPEHQLGFKIDLIK